MSKIKFGIMGNGYLAGIIVDGYLSGVFHGYELVGILGRTPHKIAAIAERGGCGACSMAEGLPALKPGIITEAASIQCVRDNAQKMSSVGANLIVLSIGAFVDEVFYDKMKEIAIRRNSKVHIASGTVGGFDVFRTIFLMGRAKSSIRTKEGPASLMNTPLYDDDLMTEEGGPHVFPGNAKEAISILPTKVNVAITASPVTTGSESTSVNIFSMPGIMRDNHKVTMGVDEVKTTVGTCSSISVIAGQSVVVVLKNLVSPTMFQGAPLQTEGTRQMWRIN